MRYKASQFLLGFLLLAVGVGLLGNALNIWHFSLFFKGWWSLFLIIPAVHGLTRYGYSFPRLILLATGLLFFANAQGFLPIRPSRLIVPIALIGLGVLFVSSKIVHSREESPNYNTAPREASPSYLSIFNDSHVRNDSQDFKNGSATCIFGDLNVDLENAGCRQDAYFQSTSIFGDLKIKVPASMRLDIRPFAVFGEVKNKTVPQDLQPGPVFHINCTSIFGDVVLK